MNEKKPQVTVLMSVYNAERYLDETVQSILQQTFTDFEFIIVNDCCTDRSPEILEGYTDPRIRIINNKKNVGLTRSLNIGLKDARGEYIARIDADDIAFPERLAEQVHYLDQHADVGLVGSGFEIINDDGVRRGEWNPRRDSEEIYYVLTFYNCISHPSVLMRRSLVSALGGYDEALPRVQDADLWFRISRRAKIVVLNKELIKWRDRKTSVQNYDRRLQDEWCRKVFAKNVATMMCDELAIDDVLCFHDEGYPLRGPLFINYKALCQLERIQEALIAQCPSDLNVSKLRAYCDYKLQLYICSLILKAQFSDLIRLRRRPRFKKALFDLTKNSITIDRTLLNDLRWLLRRPNLSETFLARLQSIVKRGT